MKQKLRRLPLFLSRGKMWVTTFPNVSKNFISSSSLLSQGMPRIYNRFAFVITDDTRLTSDISTSVPAHNSMVETLTHHLTCPFSQCRFGRSIRKERHINKSSWFQSVLIARNPHLIDLPKLWKGALETSFKNCS